MTIRAMIVEDEELARQRLKVLLQDYPWIQLVAECADGLSGLETIEREKPDLVFLDIQMPGLTGFDVLARLKHDPKIIFTTAYDQYALQAFEYNSIAYLLKPIEKDKLDKAVQKVRLEDHADSALARSALLDQLSDFLNKQEPKYIKRLQVKIGDRILLLGLDEILYFESEDKYTTVVTEGKKHIIDTPLVELEAQLDPEKFIRIHRSCLVNVNWVAEIQRQMAGKLHLQLRDKDKTQLSVSRSYVDRVRSL